MAKVLKTAAIVVGVAALAVVTGGAAVGLGVSLATSVAGISAGTLLLASSGLSLAAGLLAKRPKPTIPSSQTSRLSASIDPGAFRKTVLGQTAMATDVRYEEWSGTNQDYCDWIIALASHAIDGVEEIWLNTDLAWSATTGVTAKFAGYFWVPNIILEGTPENAFTFGSGKWNAASSRLTGCAYLRLRFKVTGNSKKSDSPFSGGPTSRITIIGRGAKLYDPRRDDTVPGGSGPMRWDDQTTWRYTADDGTVIGENLPLQILYRVLGWRIRNPVTNAMKLAVGNGVPGRRIGMESFQVAANLADELVNRSAGGQEPRYHGAGVISEGDDNKTILDALCAGCCGRFRDTGGKLDLVIAHNDLASAATDDGLNDDDVIGPFTWDPDPSLDQTPNVVRGKYIDPSTGSLYQPIDYPEVRLDSPDGQDRVFSLDLGYVESPSQAQRVGKQVLERKQYQRRFTAPFDIRAWKYPVGALVPFTFASLSFVRKLFRVEEQELGQNGTCNMTLLEESAQIYAWDADDSAPVQPADAIVYDARNNPLILAIDDAATSANWSNIADDDGNKPDDNATVGAPPGTNVGDRPVEDMLNDLDGAMSDIDDLFATYSDTASAAASAVVATEKSDLAAAYSRTRGLTPNGNFDADATGWAVVNGAWAASYGGSMAGCVQGDTGKQVLVTPSKAITVDTSRTYRLNVRFGSDGDPLAIYYAGLQCLDADGNFLGNIYMTDVAGQSRGYNVFEFANDYTGENFTTIPVYSGGNSFPVGTKKVQLIWYGNYTSVAGVFPVLDAFYLEDVTNAVASKAQADIATQNATVASEQAALASASKTLSAAYAASRGITPNAGFDAGATGWYDALSSGVPSPTGPFTTHLADTYQGRSKVLVSDGDESILYVMGTPAPVDTTRKYRMRLGIYSSGGGGIVYAGFSSRTATGTSNGANTGLSYPLVRGATLSAGWHDITSDVITGEGIGNYLFTAGTKQAAPAVLLNYNHIAGSVFGVDYCYLEDVTESEEARTQAGISSSEAAIATAQAAAARQSALLSAQAGSGLSNLNAMFADWPNAAGLPTNYNLGTGITPGSNMTRVTGITSAYAARVSAAAGADAYFVQSGVNAPWTASPGDWVVLEADIKLNSGSLLGSGVLFRVAGSGEVMLRFASDKTSSDGAVGAGVAGKTYSYKKLVQIGAGSNTSSQLYPMNHWTGFGQSIAAANDITWYRFGWRPAAPHEIATGQIDDLAASVSQQAGAIADLQAGKAEASTVEALQATAADQAAEITAAQSVAADAQGKANAIVGIKLDVNGKISGYASENDGETSKFGILSDVFEVTGGTGVHTEYSDGSWKVYYANGQIAAEFGIYS